MEQASETLYELRPVTFRYSKDIDAQGRQQFGLVAEDVEKVNRDLIVRDDEGKPYSVRYDQVNVMLLNEFLKEHKAFINEQQKVTEQGRKIQEQEAAIAQLKQEMQMVVARLKEQDS
jgi:endosialidase-like protein